MARECCPEFEFVVADLSDPEAMAGREYDCVLALECLDHLEDDIGVLGSIRAGTLVIASVPNFWSPVHVRVFADANAVRERYQHLFSSLRVVSFLQNANGMRLFLVEGTRS